ncbi:methyltransferase RsmF C-terminal domain-like protein [Prevotella sp. AGR2160]|uniref:methyltransferase RsmF C-terminal domain-like protein n=1 Tax=Prevotella sp. AGR2160 TaxID=1280674 RepID=UPI00041F346B|nr:hypothetical protein [Prevotella sp. AGR2160]
MEKLPDSFLSYTRQLLGDELFGTLLSGLEAEAPVSIRLNPYKCPKGTTVGNAGGRVPWCPEGWYLNDRPTFTLDPLLHAGLYYVQEASSMFISHIVHTLVHEPVTALDLCAAPGGKTTCMMSALPDGSTLFSNEPICQRAQVLSENIQKYGHPAITVTNNYPKDYGQSGLQFDLILTDVPCSGEGMFRKDPGAITEWSPEKVEECWRLQRSIVEDVWPSLKPGGILIYSTCTFNAHEDEENVEWIARELGAESVTIPTDPAWNITGALVGNRPCYRFLPGKTIGEGLFVSVLRKTGDTKPATGRGRGLHVLSQGIHDGVVKGKNLIPDVSMALSIEKDKEQYPLVDVDWPTAIAYLRRESVVLPPETPRGIVRIAFRGQDLGFAKNIGNRANNLYPQAWAIKTTYIKEPCNNILIY